MYAVAFMLLCNYLYTAHARIFRMEVHMAAVCQMCHINCSCVANSFGCDIVQRIPVATVHICSDEGATVRRRDWLQHHLLATSTE
jgi:hypothetical protein